MSVRCLTKHRRGVIPTALAALAALAAAPATAIAAFESSGSGTGSGSVGTLSAPAITSATAGAGTVNLQWSGITPPPGAGAATYYVSRNGGAPGGNCPTSASPTSAISCVDTGLSKGTYSYTVTAVWQSWTARSIAEPVTVSYGAVAKLVFTTQPDGSATGGVTFPQQPVVTAEDSGGNTVQSYSGTVSLSIKSGTSGASLSGCGGSLSNGVTTFSGCKIDKSGTYVLTAGDGALSTDSTSFTVSVGSAAKLVFTQQPDGAATGGVAFPTQPKVAVEDAGGNIVTTDSSTVALSITSKTPTSGGPGTLSGCTPAESNGVVTFSGCSINTAGSNYELHATDGALTPTDSSPFNIAVGPAARLLFTTQPDGSATVGAAFPQQPVVTAEDAGGNVVTTYSKTVGLSIATGPAGAALSGCTASLTSGVTTFSGCQVNVAGSYTLNATDNSSPVLTVSSSAFTVTSTLTAASVAEAAGLSATVTTASIAPVSGSTYLIFVYCSGQNAACNGTSARASVSSPAFSSVSFDDAIGTGTSKDCLEVFTATGSSTSGTVTTTGASGQNIGFVNVVQLSPNAKVQNAPGATAQGASSPATATLTSPPSNFGELVPVAVADGNGATSISVQTPATGMSMLGKPQQSSTVGADMWVFFDSTAQASASFPLNPTTPLNGWATFAIEVG